MQKLRTDGRPRWDSVFGVYGYPVLLIEHRLKLFPLPGEQARTLAGVCGALSVKQRPAEAILTAAMVLGFVQLCDGRDTRHHR